MTNPSANAMRAADAVIGIDYLDISSARSAQHDIAREIDSAAYLPQLLAVAIAAKEAVDAWDKGQLESAKAVNALESALATLEAAGGGQ